MADEPLATGKQRTQFQPGNRAAVGRATVAQKMAEYRRIILDSVTREDVQKIVNALTLKASKGDERAGRLLLGYLAGAPLQTVDMNIGDSPISIQLRWDDAAHDASAPSGTACCERQPSEVPGSGSGPQVG